jgi:hypothetical protein
MGWQPSKPNLLPELELLVVNDPITCKRFDHKLIIVSVLQLSFFDPFVIESSLATPRF